MTSSTLKNILEQTILGCQNVRSIIRVYGFNDFQNQTLSKKITIEFERVKFEDQCTFSIDIKNASQETENYAYEIIGRVLDRFKGNKIT